MATSTVIPVLLETKESCWAESITSFPKTATGLLVKQLQWLLSYPNQDLGRPFLEGNFAPQRTELFQQNLPLITDAGEVGTMARGTGVDLRVAAHEVHMVSTGPSMYPSSVNGLSNGHVTAVRSIKAEDGWRTGHADFDKCSTADDTKRQQNSAGSSHTNGHANGHTSGHVIGHTNGHANGHTDRHSNGQFMNGIANGLSNGHDLSSEPVLFGLDHFPEGLSGVFMRVGPNPLLQPLGGYHWFDGDGMVHAVRIKDGRASYCNRWVPTSRLKQEVAAGWPVFIKLGDYPGLRGLGHILLQRAKTALGLVDTSAGGGTANTALVCHASRLLALNEGDLPYALKVMCDGLIESVGRLTVSGPVGRSFTAHPKLDPVTGELHFSRYTFEKAPYVSYGVLGPRGDLIKQLDITAANIKRPTMMHDFAITEHWALFLDNPLCFDGERMVKHGQLPFSFKGDQGSRVGLLPRDATDDSSMIWFTLPAHMVFHVVNAWEEHDGTVKLFVCYHDSISLNLDTRSTGDIPLGEQPRVAEITLDLKHAQRIGVLRIMTSTVGDFPQINTRFVGRKHRYAYVATMVTGFGAAVKWDGVAKLDLWAQEGKDALLVKAQLPAGCYNGETVFVPRFEDPSMCDGEDDGHLISYVHDECSGASGSSMVIWDAKTLDSQPLAVVQLPQRVPYGFHALWVPESQFQQQLKGHPLQPMSVV